MSYVARKSRNELYRTNTCGVSHHRATPAVCSESFHSKETEAFPEHQDSLYVLCIHTNTHTHTSQRRFMSHRSPSPLSQGPNGPIGPTGPPGSRGSTGPKVSCLPRRRTPCSAADSEWNLNFDETPVLQGDPGLPGPPGEKVRPLIRNSLRVPWWDIFGKRLRWS